MKKCQTENQNRDSYQTGKTVPPKNYQGLITVLLILIIFLGGIVSALSMLNMRLFRMLESQNNSTEDSSLQFSRKTEALPESVRDGVEIPALGLTGQEVTELCRSYYGWPEGLYVSGLPRVRQQKPICAREIFWWRWTALSWTVRMTLPPRFPKRIQEMCWLPRCFAAAPA